MRILCDVKIKYLSGAIFLFNTIDIQQRQEVEFIGLESSSLFYFFLFPHQPNKAFVIKEDNV